MSEIKSETAQTLNADGAEALMTTDGKIIVIEYDVGQDKPLRVALPFDVTRDLLAKITHLATATLDAPSFIRMTPVTAVDAQPTDIPGHLSFTLYDEMKLAHHWALPLELSVRLRPRLRAVEAASKQDGRPPRAN